MIYDGEMTVVISLFLDDMKKKTLLTKIADILIRYNFVKERTNFAFLPFHADCAQEAKEVLSVTEEDINNSKLLYEDNSTDEYIEYMELCKITADTLLKYKKCLFHGVAFTFCGKAYIFTAPSGTGKSTQYFWWKLLYKDEIQIINGDKPVLDFSSEDGTVMVHSSPWRGKEGMGSMIKAPLGGIIYLNQGAENTMCRVNPKDVIIPILQQFICSMDTKERIRMICQLEDQLLRSVPVWKLENRGDEASAALCYHTILQEVEKDEV